MISISLVFDHHHRARKGDEGPVEVRVTANRKPYYINTGVRVREDRLVGNAVRDVRMRDDDGVVRMTDDADILNERLTSIVKFVEREVNACLDERRAIDVADIRRRLWELEPAKDDDDGRPLMTEWIKQQASVANITTATKKRYTTLCNKMKAYGRLSRWDDLTVENIYAWDVWLRRQPVPMTENKRIDGIEAPTLQQSAVYNYHKLLKAMLNRAMMLGVISANPYDRMKGVFRKVTKETIDYLTQDQMRKVMELTPVPGSQAETAIDLFRFQMFTGLSYADTQVFDIKNYRQEKGRWVLVGQRVKTGVPYVSQLLPPVIDVLKRHGMKVPRMANQRYNQMLKAVGMVIGIAKLHSHMARHTFATYMLSQGVKIENVSRMLGHTNIMQTQRYAKVLAESVHEDFDMIERKLKTDKI